MTQIICDDAYNGEDPLNRPRPWKKSDRLTPAPPKGWLIMIGLARQPRGPDIGCWICALWSVKHLEDSRGQRLHQIARDPKGTRYLVLDPSLKKFAEDIIGDFNSRLTGCNCGGSECLAGDLQFAALKSLASRAWSKLPIPKRIEFIQAHNDEDDDELSVRVALLGPAFIQGQDDWSTRFLEALIQA